MTSNRGPLPTAMWVDHSGSRSFSPGKAFRWMKPSWYQMRNPEPELPSETIPKFLAQRNQEPKGSPSSRNNSLPQLKMRHATLQLTKTTTVQILTSLVWFGEAFCRNNSYLQKSPQVNANQLQEIVSGRQPPYPRRDLTVAQPQALNCPLKSGDLACAHNIAATPPRSLSNTEPYPQGTYSQLGEMFTWKNQPHLNLNLPRIHWSIIGWKQSWRTKKEIFTWEKLPAPSLRAQGLKESMV